MLYFWVNKRQLFELLEHLRRGTRSLQLTHRQDNQQEGEAEKSELAALDRKITPTLAPKNDDTTDGEKVRPVASQ